MIMVRGRLNSVSADLITAPAPYTGDRPAVFLAGGITACPDWQTEAATALAGLPVTILNPRRPAFDLTATGVVDQQIRWEFEHRQHPALFAMLFWFPASDPAITVQPIALLELGEAFARSVPIVLGADPGYPRRTDVVLQTALARPEVTVRASLSAVVEDLTTLLAWAARG